MAIKREKNTSDVRDVRKEKSILGDKWTCIYARDSDGTADNFEKAMDNIIRHPNLNSTIIMRADVLKIDDERFDIELDKELCPYTVNADDLTPRVLNVGNKFNLKSTLVRRIVPRNPQRDPVINQTCVKYTSDNACVVVYVPHLENAEQIPYYLPPAKGVALVYKDNEISVHYSMFDEDEQAKLVGMENTDRCIRIALRLLETSSKHSSGARQGYQKRVNHDLVVDKVKFQDLYILLKQKYAKQLVANWAEVTDPKKHVFEDLAIASFLILLWDQVYKDKSEFQFADLGCGNGLLVYILMQEGYNGFGIDARARKSWVTYPESVQSQLKEQVLVPRVLLDDDAPELKDAKLNTLPVPENTFLIGNHSDELTVWIPLLGFPFMVIPCCSHALSGAKHRFTPKNQDNKSSYASLVDHVEEIATKVGWKVEKERLRIPSTRNAALIGRLKIQDTPAACSTKQIIESEGGVEGWVKRCTDLMAKNPRGH